MIEQPAYADSFHAGQRAHLKLPLGQGASFLEWGIIDSVAADTVALLLSRDQLPRDIRLNIGEPASIRAGSRGQGYRCNALIEAADGAKLTLKLCGPIIPDELRSYYRLDTDISLEWTWADGDGIWNPGASRISGTGRSNPASDDNGMAPPSVVNISGGGIRAELNEELQVGSIVNLKFTLPHPHPQQLPTVAEVVYCQPRQNSWRSPSRFITGMRYVNIHERSRDRIIQYVCSEEMNKIRLCNKDFHYLNLGRT